MKMYLPVKTLNSFFIIKYTIKVAVVFFSKLIYTKLEFIQWGTH